MSEHRYYLDDFIPGQELALGSFSLSEAEIIAFARQFDPQPFHIDPVAARASIYGGIIASGWHTCSQMMRIVTDNLLNHSSSMGSPGLEIEWIKPVRPDEVMQVSYLVEQVKPSASKPDRGMVFSQWKLSNAQGELVCRLKTKGMFGRRASAV
jgi:acyl dehydratase